MCLATQSQLQPQHLKAVEPLLRPCCQYGHDPFMDGRSLLITQCSDDLPRDNMLTKCSLYPFIGRFHI